MPLKLKPNTDTSNLPTTSTAARTNSKNSGARDVKKNLFESDRILKDVCICLTGLAANEKSRLHSLVEVLGGRYIRDLVTQKTTHLISERAEGEKYIQANKCAHIEIVTPKWLEECANQKVRLSTHDFRLVGDSDANTTHIYSASNAADTGTTDAFQTAPFLEMATKSLLSDMAVPPNPLFSGCCFYLVGFPQEELNHMNKMSSSLSSRDHSRIKLKKDFCRLIRRGMGTIFWEVNKDITHVIVSEESDMKTRNDVNNFCSYHPNGPIAIAPEWVIACLQNKHLTDAKDYPPNRRVSTLRVKKKSSKSPIKRSSRVQIFSDLFFHILSPAHETKSAPTSSVSAPTNTNTNTNASFDAEKFETLIRLHGGRLLSRDGIRLLQNLPNVNATSGSKRKQIPKCYLVHLSGAFHLEKVIKSDALLRHISQHNLCNIIPVNPIWLQTCDMNQAEIDPYDHAQLFIPHKLPIQMIQNENGVKLKVAVTGFMGVERIGLRNMLVSIGAGYTENMGSTNTHLICKEAVGPKYLKAVEWNLHVVSVDWLFRICHHGYQSGCEDDFSLLQAKEAEEENENSQGTTVLSSQVF